MAFYLYTANYTADAVKALIRFVQLGQIVERDHSGSPLRLGDPSV